MPLDSPATIRFKSDLFRARWCLKQPCDATNTTADRNLLRSFGSLKAMCHTTPKLLRRANT